MTSHDAVKCWVVEPVNEPRQFVHADQMWNVSEGNLVFTLNGVLVHAFARDSYFEVSLAEDGQCTECAGRCGDQAAPALFDAPPLLCELPTDHDGWHGASGTHWLGLCPNAAPLDPT